MDNPKISIEVFAQIKAIFEYHHWSIDQENTFDRFCQMLSLLDNEQQKCIMELTKKFLRVDFAKYPNHINRALANIQPDFFNDTDRIYVMPLRSPEDFGKQKSSTFVAYGFYDYKTHNLFLGKNLNIIDALGGIPKNINVTKSMLILVDDFIGSGETAESCLNYLEKDVGIDLSKVMLLALIVQKEGWTKLTDMGHKLVCSEIRNKGITDEFQEPIKQEFIKAMQSIEDIFKYNAEFRFGYRQSEALVKMIRTPNNTFPIYWKSTNTPKHNAPFPR
jgi:hypothetical protein